MEKEKIQSQEEPKKILAHICCAVDAIYFLKRLREDFPKAEIIGFFYDPNIHPYEEYLLRLKESQHACNLLGIKFIEGDYNLEGWLNKVKGYEHYPEKGARCVLCFDDRLQVSVEKAKELGCDSFTTTLLMSPKKSQEQLLKVGKKLENLYGVRYIHKDYRKGGGVQEMNRLVREKEIWRQDYCGCMFALFQQKGEESLFDLVGFKGRLPGTKEEHIFIRQLKVEASLKGLPTREEEFQFIGWYPLRGKLEIPKLKKVIPSLIKPFSSPIRGIAKADAVEKVGDLIFYNKQNLTVQLVDRLEDYPINGSVLGNPTFLVERKYEKLLLENRIAASLEVKIKPSKSRNLIIGDIKTAQRLFLIPADTLQCGKGISPERVSEMIKTLEGEIRNKETALVILGAQSFNVGYEYLKQRHPYVEEKKIEWVDYS
jgi:predicted adenine nucleotide alpha hydrolase (AANH) superfamily ATPase